jgi:hypothetical protein
MPVNALAPEPRNAMLRPYEPTWKEQIAAYLMGNTRPSPERRQFAQGIADILGYLPGTGNILQGQEAARAGDTKGAIMAMLPLPGANVAARAEQAIAQDVAKGIRAYHGSPHSFERFDISKIGSGEGAQSFGHGLYFAEAENLAKYYRDKLTHPLYKGKPIGEIDIPHAEMDVAEIISNDIKQGMPPSEAIALAQKDHLRYAQHAVKEFKESPPELKAIREDYARKAIEQAKIARTIKPEDFTGNTGHMYEVSINARPEELLDWDKTLSAQSPEVLAAFMKLPNAERKLKEYGNVPVGQLMESGLMPHSFDISDPAFSKTYSEAGIKGVRYLDAKSRAAGEGSRNYVVFDDKLVEIMRKYGLMGPIGAGIAAKILARQEQRQDM